MFVRRGSGGASEHLDTRVRILGLGAVLALVGMATARDWLVNLAIGVLVLGFGLRFLGRRPRADDGPDEDAS